MFGDQLYPTPPELVHEMINGLDLSGKRILDPSAGKGDLLEFIRNNSRLYKTKLFAIEIDPNLRAVLREKGFSVIDSDFLLYPGHMLFDYIVMNPPFRNGAKHLLKAYEIGKGAVIKCLLNTESLTNPNSMEKNQLVDLINRFGTVKNLGKPFKNSENITDVEVVLVTLYSQQPPGDFRFEFVPDFLNNSFNSNDLTEDKELAVNDMFGSYEAQYNAAVRIYQQLLSLKRELSYYVKGLLPAYKSEEDLLKFIIEKDNSYEKFLEELTRLAWDNIFKKTKLAGITTQGVRDKIKELQNEQSLMSFTVQNMEELFYSLAGNRDKIMIDCILEVFDKLTKHHDQNREYIETWKSNSSYQVGKKFILPGVRNIWGGEYIDYQAKETLDDIEKSLCFLSAKRYENIETIAGCYASNAFFGQKIISEFFETKLFKKGTMHFWWRDDNLRKDFNLIVAKHRPGGLPEVVKKGVYR